MKIATDRLAILREFGLTEYQARTYLALLGLGTAAAGAVTNAASLPRNRVYETLQSLAELGLVEVVLDESRRYRALPLEPYVERWAAELEQRANEGRRRAREVAHAFAPAEAALGHEGDRPTRGVFGRREVLRHLERLLEEAQEQLVVQMTPGAARLLSRRLLSTPLKPGLRVRVRVPRAALAMGGLEPLLDAHREHVEVVDHVGPCWAVISEREMLLVRPEPDDSGTSGHDGGLLIASPAMIADRLALLEGAQAPPAQLVAKTTGASLG